MSVLYILNGKLLAVYKSGMDYQLGRAADKVIVNRRIIKHRYRSAQEDNVIPEGILIALSKNELQLSEEGMLDIQP